MLKRKYASYVNRPNIYYPHDIVKYDRLYLLDMLGIFSCSYNFYSKNDMTLQYLLKYIHFSSS